MGIDCSRCRADNMPRTMGDITTGDYPQLTRPPLREAVIDIRLRDSLPSGFLETLRSLALPRFSNVGDIQLGGFKLEIGIGKPAQAIVTSDEVLGVRFQSLDGAQVLQYHRNGVTFSVLRNYTAWEPFVDEARKLWQEFLRISGAAVVSRVGIRYINSIEIPTGADFDDYLTAGPRIPKPLPQIVTGFLQRVIVPFAEIDGYAIITQALEQPTDKSLPTIIDIDVASNCSMDGEAPEVWHRLTKLRNVKNQIFFASVTPKALEAYR
jgi:uncharacterized protein (TIGR04255 family)